MFPKNIATSVVPPPISTRATPSRNSSSSSVATADAKGSKIKSLGTKPALSTHLIIFLTALTCAVMTWKLASSFTPDIPIGSSIPSSPSTVYS